VIVEKRGLSVRVVAGAQPVFLRRRREQDVDRRAQAPAALGDVMAFVL